MAYSPPRVHVGPHDWDNGAATDYWINFNAAANQVAAAAATNPGGLSGWFHTTTSLVATAGTAGDMNVSTDFTPSHILTDAANDAFVSPRIFGGYDQFQRVADILGYAPTKIRLDAYAAFTVNTANETTSFFGLCAPATTDTAAAGGGGGIHSDGTNFKLTSDLGTDAGAAKDNLWRKWRIEYGPTNTEWFLDATPSGTLTSQGTITTELDIWPLSFKMIVGTTNRIGLSWVHIGYV